MQTRGDGFYLLSTAVNSRGHVAAPLEGVKPSWCGLRFMLFGVVRAAGLHPRDASCPHWPPKCRMSRVSSFLLLGPPRSQGMAGVGGSCGDTGLNCHQREVLVSTPGSAGGEAGRGAGCVLPARAGAGDKETLWEVNLRGCRDSGVPLCIPANPHLPPGSCFQVAKRLYFLVFRL